MDFSSINMYDLFKDELWRELGPLDPNWFQVLTAQTAAEDEGNASDADEHLWANQEGRFKATSDKALEVETQLYSTPKAFRRHPVVSPQTEDEPSFAAEHEKGILPWTATQSPHVFTASKQGVADVKYGDVDPRSEISFDLLRSPQKSPSSYAKHISESLGAQMNPDFSWTSSFNTPPAVPSTLILSKKDTSPCPTTFPEEHNVVFVRKLFPSLSKPSAASEMPPQSSDIPPVHQAAVSSEDVLHPSDGVWPQKLPDAVDDAEISSTVSGVVGGAEDALSAFFTSSSSSLRKVKPARIRPKPIFPTKELCPSSADAPSSSVDAQKSQSDVGLSQWSPLSLSDIPASAQQSQSDSDALRATGKLPASGPTKKKRTFVYTVAASKPQVQSKESGSQTVEASTATPDSAQHSSTKPSGKAAPDELGGSTSAGRPQGGVTQELLPPSAQAKDLDMSQLCKEFAQDFSPTSDSESHFSPSAVLQAVKQARQKAAPEAPHHVFNVSHRIAAGLTNYVDSINDGVAADSGFQSAATDVSHLNASSLVSQLTSRGDAHGTSTRPSADKEEKVDLGSAVSKLCSGLRTQLEERETENPGRSSDAQRLTTSEQPAISNRCIALNAKLQARLSDRSTSPSNLLPSGFKTASDKSIQVSSASLERGRSLLQEADSGNTLNLQPTKSCSATKPPMSRSSKPQSNFSDSNHLPSSEDVGDVGCQLTESQKADVTELCTLLEEAESQFEFTQMRSVSQSFVTSVDADLLMGIDFDDSFSSEAYRPPPPSTGTSDGTASVASRTECGTSDTAREHEHESDAQKKVEDEGLHSAEAENSERSSNPSALQVAFKSSGGKILTVSKAGLNKARTLFADLEKLTDVESADLHLDTKQNVQAESSSLGEKVRCLRAEGVSGDHMITCQSGFHMASGKSIVISAKSLQQARDLFTDCDATETSSRRSEEEKKSSVNKKSFISDLQTCRNVDAHQMGPDEEEINSAARNAAPTHDRNPSSTSEPVSSSPYATSEDVESSTIAGFCTASGKKVTVSADSLRRAEDLLSEGRLTPEDADGTRKTGTPFTPLQATLRKAAATVSSAALRKAKALIHRRGEVDDDDLGGKAPQSHVAMGGPPPRTTGFVSASGKPVALSSEALLRAEALFSDIHLSVDDSAKRSDSKEGFSGGNGTEIFPDGKTEEKIEELKAEVEGPVSAPVLQETDCVDRNPLNGNDHKNQTFSGQQVTEEHGDERMKGFHEQVKPRAEAQKAGFQTAGGKTISVSSEALRKAATLLSEGQEEEAVEARIRASSSLFKVPLPAKQVCVSSESLRRAEALFSDVGLSDEVQAGGFSGKVLESQKQVRKAKRYLTDESFIKRCDEDGTEGNQTPNTFPPLSAGFQTASGKTVSVSCEALRKAKSLLSECEAPESGGVEHLPPFKAPVSDPHAQHMTLSSEALFSDVGLRSEIPTRSDDVEKMRRGFTTARGEKVCVSQKSLLKAKSLFKEFEDPISAESGADRNVKAVENEPLMKENLSDQRTKTEDGSSEDTNKQVEQRSNAGPAPKDAFQEVPVSSEAQRKAETLLSECEEVEDKAGGGAPPHFKVPLPRPASRNCGFQAASGKKVSVSSEALQKAEALFSDISFSASSASGTTDDDGANPQVFSGFSTAGGAKVHVSHRNLLKAKRVLEEVDNEKSSAHERVASGGRSLTSELATENSSSCIMKESDDTMTCQDQVTSVNRVDLHQSSRREKPNAWKRVGDSWKCMEGGKKESLISFPCLQLSGCSETQQDLVAQEAMDCTKALLEDESQPFSPPSEPTSFTENPDSSRGDKGKGKRWLRHDDPAAQPPMKRRLLQQFDRTVDGSRSFPVQPVTSCPTSILKDRGVFKFGVSLHPNVTKPPRNTKNQLEQKLQSTNQTSASGDDQSACFKTPSLVPPFSRNARGKVAAAVEDKARARAPAFVPPFKKQRTSLQENAAELRRDAEGGEALKSSDSSFAPPTKKTDGSVLTDATNVAVTNGHVLPEGGGATSCDGAEGLHQNLENTALARDLQDMRIRKKKRQKVRALPGSLFLRKTSGEQKIPLKAAVEGKAPGKYTPAELYALGVHWHVAEVTSENAESFRFNLLLFVKREALAEGGGVQLGDGGWLIPANDGTAGKEEFYRALCDTPGVDPELLSEAWTFNHYRWVVWKQASMEKSFPEFLGGLCLSPQQVLLQLKFRYDLEVDHSRRPALRKILEQDDTAAKTLVLCLSEVVSRGRDLNGSHDADSKTPQTTPPPAVVGLSDGWYQVRAQLDRPLSTMLRRGRLAVGTKLMVHGAQLVGSQEACPPLEAPESLMLKISANSARRVRWDLKLGFYKDPRPFLLPLSCLFHDGGPVGCVDLLVLRSYPLQWMERKADGGVVFRDARAEEKEARRHSGLKQRAMEVVFAKVQRELEEEEKGNAAPRRRRPARSRQDIAALQEGEELHEAVGDDPADLEALLTEGQLEALSSYRRSLLEKKQQELQDRCRRRLEAEDGEARCPERDVTPVWRLSVADSRDGPGKVYQLNVWRPTSDLQSLLKEGRRYKVYNLVASEGKRRSGVENLQLSATKKTQFQEMQVSPEWLSTRFQPRVSTSFISLHNFDLQAPCGEVDLTGYVISVVDHQGSSPAFYLCDEEQNFVKVRCFSSFSQCGLEDVVHAGVLLALSNLQLRGQSSNPTPVLYAGDLSLLSTNPREAHLQESLRRIKAQIQTQVNFFQSAEEKLSHLIKSGTPSCFPAALTTPGANAVSRPVRSLGSFTPVSRNPAAPSEKDARSVKRKRALDYLSHMPSPPPLCPLGSLASPCVKKTFNPPRRTATPRTLEPEPSPDVEAVQDEELAMIDTQALCVE
ncbi:unnamed protein product [Ophioblennius macclurei]